MREKSADIFESVVTSFTRWIGSLTSIVLHTVLFLIAFGLVFFGVRLETVLLVLTTAVSLEAIYLALFIQMTVNKNTTSLENVEEDIDEIERDIDEIERDIDEIEAHDEQEDIKDKQVEDILTKIQSDLADLAFQIEKIKK